MNNDQTIEKLRQMRLTAHLKDNRTGKSAPDRYLAPPVDHQWEDRQNKKTERLLKQANFKQPANLADIDHVQNRNLDRNMFERLATLDFMARKENTTTGASGTGKSYLGQALGNQACTMQYRTIYSNTARLLKKLKLCKVDGTYLKELNKPIRADLLILDDFGLQSFDNHAREALMDIIDGRHNRTSTIIASRIPVSAWYDIIGEGTTADAILDRIVNSSHRIDLKGESLRKGILKKE